MVDGQYTPNTSLKSVPSILNHVTAILYPDGVGRVICEVIFTKGPDNSGKLLREVAVQLTAQSGRKTVSGC